MMMGSRSNALYVSISCVLVIQSILEHIHRRSFHGPPRLLVEGSKFFQSSTNRCEKKKKLPNVRPKWHN